MYTPRAFAESDLSELDGLVARDAFATLVSAPDGAPVASHLPVLYSRSGTDVHFRGHWARPNPQWRRLDGERALLIVHGPHAYISPSWYADPEARVPTWNYAVAHVSGRVRVFEDVAELAQLVDALARKYEDGVGSAWRFDPGFGDNRAELRGIVGFELVAERVEIKFKLNQNHPAANVAGAATGLERLGGEDRLEVATLMRDRLARRVPPKE
jgi:transcriptional regulator